ncbi:hypothetical protein CDAR_503351 [Caerostris darwini]|uniref:Uncharacterized protein n=1 Tax=Caerostris darwini TaxID=1538125 RepID=A0AAV4NX07_9ARAC|nr:hypothetical protein CDAR_503351 [Caerostris darwini]
MSKSSYRSFFRLIPLSFNSIAESLLDFLTCLTLRNVLRLDLSASRVSGVVCPKSSKCPKQPSKICFVTQVKRLGLKVLWKGKISRLACRKVEFRKGNLLKRESISRSGKKDVVLS